jgi:hypothetical protein
MSVVFQLRTYRCNEADNTTRQRQDDWPVAVNSVSKHLPDALTSIELGKLDALERVLRIALDA